MLAVFLFLPMVAALASLCVPSDRLRLAIVQAVAVVEVGIVALLFVRGPLSLFGRYLFVDAAALLVLGTIWALFLGIAFYLRAYLARAEKRPLRGFAFALLILIDALSWATVSQHLGVFWVALEAATLASAPLIYFHQSGKALEAAWKYIIVGSVGIALALLGTIFLAVAATDPATGETTLWLPDLLAGRAFSKPWLHAAFVFLLVGYGTKMGLAPMHAWKPDAYGEAPPPVAALMAGGLTTVAFLGIVRVTVVLARAGEAAFASSLLVLLGLVSLGVAAAFVVGQSDLRRLLAYSSIENMGVLVFGLGFGALGTEGAMLQVVNNALNKGIMFLVAGNLLQTYGTTTIGKVRGALTRTPLTGVLLMAGAFAAMGLPPFGLFVSEVTVLRAVLAGGAAWTAALYLGFLSIIFLGMAAAFLPMAQGEAPANTVPIREPWSATLPSACFAVGALVLGVYVPRPLLSLIHVVAQQMGPR
jgi:hydrogenase-4 component F